MSTFSIKEVFATAADYTGRIITIMFVTQSIAYYAMTAGASMVSSSMLGYLATFVAAMSITLGYGVLAFLGLGSVWAVAKVASLFSKKVVLVEHTGVYTPKEDASEADAFAEAAAKKFVDDLAA